nr:MAG: putative replicase [Inner Mongolia alphaflexi-like virus 1]
MSAVRAILDSFRDCGVKASIEETALKHVKEELKAARVNNPYAVPHQAADALETLGVATDPYSVKLHTHAADKALENRMLEIVGQHLPKEPTTLLFLKPSKLRLLRRGPQQGDVFRNKHIEPKDIPRYPEDTVHELVTSVTTKVAYMSDTLHFLNPRQLVSMFANSPSLETVYATLVLPIEAMYKHTSLYPDVYTVNYDHDGFQYLPGGHGGGAYSHEFEQLQWLTLGQIRAGPHTLTLQKLESLGAHHLFIVTRGDWLHPRVHVYEADTMVTLPRIFTPPHANATQPLRKTLAMQLLLYVKSIKQVTERDVYAKIRQLIKTSELALFSPAQLIHYSNFFLYVAALSAVNDYPALTRLGLFGRISAPIRARLAEVVRFFSGATQFQALLELAEWTPFTYTQPCKVVHLKARPQPARRLPEPSHAHEGPPVSLAQVVAHLMAKEAGHKRADAPPATHEPDGCSSYTPTPATTCVSRDDSQLPSPEPEAKQPGAAHTSSAADSDTGLTNARTPLNPDQWPLAARFGVPFNDLGACLHQLAKDAAAGCFDEHDCHKLIPELKPYLDRPVPDVATAPENSSRRAKLMTLVDQGADLLGYCANLAARRSRIARTLSSEAATCVPALPDDRAEQADVLAPWRSILEAAGFHDIQPQQGPAGTILPVERVHQPAEPRVEPDVDPALLTKLSALGRHPRTYTFHKDRASAYASDVKNHRVGALLKTQPREWARSFAERCDVAEVTSAVCVIHGAGGSGKSHAVQSWARPATPGAFTVVCPTVELRNDWSSKLPRTPADDIKTYEKALLQPANDVVVFDDYGKLPAGYIEAYSVLHQSVALYVLTGDFKQSVHFETNEEARTASLTPGIDHFDPLCDYYLNATHRNVKTLANAVGVCGSIDRPLRVTTSAAPNNQWPILVPGTKKKNALAEAETRALTYAGCQGLTAPKVNIIVDNATPNCSERTLYTALSRAVDEINFVSSSVDDPGFWAKMDATPYLKTFLSFVREQPSEDVAPTEPEEPADEPPRTHLPVDPASAVLEDLAAELPDKYAREFHTAAHGHSNAIQTQDPVVQLFMHQQAKDETLLKKTMDKRIKISNPIANEKEFLLKKDIGDVLFANYRAAMNLPEDPIPFEPDLWNSCRAEVERTYTAKTVQQLVNGAARQSPDFDEHKIALFLKSQWVKKTDKLGCLKVKEGQTIASFMQETVMIYGTMARYMRRMRQRYQPPHIFINSEQTPEDLDKWVAAHWNFARQAFANDYTSYDQSQDGAMLQFEAVKARFHNIPEEIVQGYIQVKMNAFLHLGTLAIMRLSGEGPTFDANTECNIAYNHMRFKIPRGTAQCYGGDDLAQDCVAPEKPSFAAYRDRLTLEGKPVVYEQTRGRYAEFCSWTLTPKGIIKDPLKLYSSLQLGLRTGKARDMLASYNKDAHYAYSKGDALQDLLSEEQLRYTFSTNRILHRHGYQPGLTTPTLSPPQRTRPPVRTQRGFCPINTTTTAISS